MRYLLLIYGPEQTEQPSPEEQAAVMQAYDVFTRSVKERGAYLGGEALEPTPTATTVRVRDDQTLTTDGPFAETKEALGGYYLLEAKDLDEAIEYAAAIPGATFGSIEVRPIRELPEDYGMPTVAGSAAAN
jgi:hypothetical protein